MLNSKVGVIGLGFVGGALKESFEKRGQPVLAYDKYKGVGSIDEVLDTDILFLCLPTPYVANYGFDLSAILENCKLLQGASYRGILVIKSTMEPGSTNKLAKQFPYLRFCHNPEFLTARTAFEDFDNQEHIVVGRVDDDDLTAAGLVSALYERLYPDALISICTSTESESMKMFANNFYAMKVQIFNEFYFLCQKTGADYENVKELMMRNGWINPMHTIVPGTDGKPSYGGACVVPETLLFEKTKGKVTAGKIQVGDEIFDGQGFTKVIKVGSRMVDSTIKIRSRGRVFHGSEDHIHMVYDFESNSFKEKLLVNIDKDDLLFVPKPKYGDTKNITLGKKPKVKGLRNWKEEVHVDEKIARLFGLYCAEGYSGIYNYPAADREFKKDYTVCWTFGEKEEFLADEVISILSSINIKANKTFKISKDATFGESRTWQVRKRSFWLYYLFQNAGLGSNAYTKDSPLFSESRAKAFISGWLDGDGYFDKSNNSISGFSRSKRLISSVDKMLLSLGIQGSITKDGQQINISRRDDVFEVLSWSNHPRFNKAPEYKTNYKWASTNSSEYKDGWLTKISSIDKIFEETKVISIETESQLYVGNGILTHNCFPKDTNALCHLMKTLGTPHKVLEACIEERNDMREEKWK